MRLERFLRGMGTRSYAEYVAFGARAAAMMRIAVSGVAREIFIMSAG